MASDKLMGRAGPGWARTHEHARGGSPGGRPCSSKQVNTAPPLCQEPTAPQGALDGCALDVTMPGSLQGHTCPVSTPRVWLGPLSPGVPVAGIPSLCSLSKPAVPVILAGVALTCPTTVSREPQAGHAIIVTPGTYLGACLAGHASGTVTASTTLEQRGLTQQTPRATGRKVLTPQSSGSFYNPHQAALRSCDVGHPGATS